MKLNEIKSGLGNDLDAIFFSSEQNRYWATSFSSSAGILLVTKNKGSFYLVDGRYISVANNHFSNSEVKVRLVKNYSSDFYGLLANLSIKKLATESDFTFVKEFNHHQKILAEKNIILMPVDCSKQRQIKSQDEIKLIQKACDISHKIYLDLHKIIQPGVSELEIAGRISYLTNHYGCDKMSFNPIVASGANSANPHAHPSSKLIEEHDVVTIDMGVVYNGFCSDMTRNFVIGKPKYPDALKVYETLKDAQQLGLDLVKKGTKAQFIDKSVRDHLQKFDLADKFIHGLGHGLGIEVHEEPYLTPTSPTTLANNMVVTVEPGVYFENKYGFRIEDDVLVNNDKCQVLTKTSKELVVLNNE